MTRAQFHTSRFHNVLWRGIYDACQADALHIPTVDSRNRQVPHMAKVQVRHQGLRYPGYHISTTQDFMGEICVRITSSQCILYLSVIESIKMPYIYNIIQ